MKLNKLQSFGLPHLLPIASFFILCCVYFAPLLSGKVLVQSDNIQLKGTLSEVNDYREKGEEIRWTNKEFAGLPVTAGSEYNVFWHLNQFLYYGFIPKPIMMVFTLFLGFYFLIQFFGVSRWLAFAGAFAFAFSTFNIISLEAGHDNKVLAIAFMSPVLLGICLAYNGQYIKGGIVTMISAGFQLLFGHVQITYYLLLMVLAYLIIVVVNTAKEKSWKPFWKATAILAFASLIAVGNNSGKLYALYEYSPYSTRGGSELSTKKTEGGGLDREYALAWSNGVAETFTILFPYFHGGATGEQLSNDSHTYEALVARGVDRGTINQVESQAPLYWGTQPFTAGPIYFGAVVVFLFLIGLLILKSPIKWWALGLTLLSLLLAMGKNAGWFTDLFFYYVPLYNKFRSVTMILSVAQLTIPLVAILVLHKILTDDAQRIIFRKRIMQAAAGIVGVGVFFLLFKRSFFDFTSEGDSRYGFPDWLLDALVDDRIAKFNSSILTSCFFVLLTAGILWIYLKGMLKLNYVTIILVLLMVIDLWVVNKRYLSSDDFQSARRFQNQAIQPTPANLQIARDTAYYRVFNYAGNPFNDGVTSYFHFSIGGYSAIKMQRYQEVIDQYISKGHQGVLSMLNTKYYIVPDDNGQPRAQLNPNANGNAWFVRNIKLVQNADEELSALEDLDVKLEAVADARFADYFKANTSTFTGEGTIALKQYHPEKMVYGSNSNTEQFAVFSEIYYAPGWKAYLDGKPVDHIRLNYLLRGMLVPAGNHEIVFKYEAASQKVGGKLEAASGILIVLVLLFGMVVSWRRSQGAS